MTSSRKNFANQQKPYERAFLRQKQFAFLTTAATIFCLLSFVSSLYMKEFQTTAYLDISASSKQPEKLFESAIGKEISDDGLNGHLGIALAQAGLGADAEPQDFDFEKIRESFDFQIAPNRSGNQFRLTALYKGSGANPERALTNSVIRGVAQRLGSMDNVANAIQQFENKYELVQNNIEYNAQQLHEELVQTNDLVNGLNSDLSDIHEAVESIRPEKFADSLASDNFDKGTATELLSSLINQLQAYQSTSEQEELKQIGTSIAKINDQLKVLNLPSTADANNSMRIINAALPEGNAAVKSILELLDNLDTDTVQARIGQIQNNLRADAVQMREDVSELRSMTNRFSESRFVVNGISDARTRPTDAIPGLGHIFLFGLTALVAATFVATYYRPELENRGFESVEAVGKSLGVPVISQLQGDGEDNTEREMWSNTLVRFCEVGLFGFVLLSVMLCVIQPDIREAFFESPFYGMSKIANLFF